MLCPSACPTGALDRITDKREVRMGIARVNTDTCYAFNYILCRTCVDECPLGRAALDQDAQLRPVVRNACVGCGICEKVCPAPEPAIVVRPEAEVHR
jgi:NAD-dependent dihydropyrimidine dehydrogenase PreA subunit